MEESFGGINVGRVEVEFPLDSVVRLRVYPDMVGIVKDIQVRFRGLIVEYLVGFVDRDEWKTGSELLPFTEQAEVKSYLPNQNFEA